MSSRRPIWVLCSWTNPTFRNVEPYKNTMTLHFQRDIAGGGRALASIPCRGVPFFRTKHDSRYPIGLNASFHPAADTAIDSLPANDPPPAPPPPPSLPAAPLPSSKPVPAARPAAAAPPALSFVPAPLTAPCVLLLL